VPLKPGTGGAGSGSVGAQDVLVLAAATILPWFWGGVGQGASRGAAAVIAMAAAWVLIRRGPSGLGFGRGIVWLLPAFLLGAFAFLQCVPLPRSWVAAVSPKAAAIQTATFGRDVPTGEAWLRQIENDARALTPEAADAPANPAGAIKLGADAPSPPARFTVSLQPGATLERAYWYAALLLAFLVVLRRAESERRASVYRTTLFVSFGLLATVGTFSHLTAPTRLLWLRDAPLMARPFGPYVNPSHFAGVMELAVPWLLGFGLVATGRRDRTWVKRAGRGLALAGAGICAAAALLSASKMGAITIGVSSALLVGIAFVKGQGRNRATLLAGSALVVAGLGAVALLGPLRERVAAFTAVHSGVGAPNVRGLVWSAGVRMGSDYPVTGSGFGAFAELFPAYLPRGESEVWIQMHNDYIELFLAGGLVAAVLAAWLAAVFSLRAARVLRAVRGNDRFLPALGLAFGLVAIAVHEGVDFNLQVPANALLFVVIAAMCVAPHARSVEAP